MIDLQRPALLDTTRHKRETFDSGEPDLDNWLRQYAGQNRRGNTAATWVIATPDDVVVACASLSMTGIDRSAAPVPLSRRAPNPVPALLIGRLAVDRQFGGLGIGTSLLRHVLATAVELNQSAALRAVVVTALHERSRTWWQRCGFSSFDPNDPDCFDLYLLTADIEATLRAQQDG